MGYEKLSEEKGGRGCERGERMGEIMGKKGGREGCECLIKVVSNQLTGQTLIIPHTLGTDIETQSLSVNNAAFRQCGRMVPFPS